MVYCPVDMGGDSGDPEVWPDESPLHLPTTCVSSAYPTRTHGGRLLALPYVGPTVRFVNRVLGPTRRIPDPSLPRPQPSLAFSFTLGNISHSVALDRPLVNLSKRCKLRYALYPFLALWATMLVLLVREQYYSNGPQIIGCTSGLWYDWPPDACGINGTDCVDFLEAATYRCLGGCLDTHLGNKRWIGGESVNSVPLVVGGDGTYRGDSWVCASAIHSGAITNRLGGCVSVRPLAFPAGTSHLVGSKANGVDSASFEPHFPAAYQLAPESSKHCLDIHPIVSGVNAFCLLLTTALLRPTPGVHFSILILLGYVQLVMFSNPRSTPPDWEWVLGGIPPFFVASYWFWRVSFKRTLSAFRHLPLDTAIWQGAGYWLGIESSAIFADLPIQRLGYDKLSASGVITLIVIIVIAVIVVLIQAWQGRKYGLLRYYIIRYIPLVPILIILANIPDYTLRLHHYLLASAAIPVLSLPNRVSLFGQSFALGLFIDGVGRWGWASILESTVSLLGDANAGTATPEVAIDKSTSTAITWVHNLTEQAAAGYTGVSVVVDDILRAQNLTLANYTFSALDLIPNVDHFFRLAFDVNGTSLDFTDPYVLFSNGSWAAI